MDDDLLVLAVHADPVSAQACIRACPEDAVRVEYIDKDSGGTASDTGQAIEDDATHVREVDGVVRLCIGLQYMLDKLVDPLFDPLNDLLDEPADDRDLGNFLHDLLDDVLYLLIHPFHDGVGNSFRFAGDCLSGELRRCRGNLDVLACDHSVFGHFHGHIIESVNDGFCVNPAGEADDLGMGLRLQVLLHDDALDPEGLDAADTGVADLCPDRVFRIQRRFGIGMGSGRRRMGQRVRTVCLSVNVGADGRIASQDHGRIRLAFRDMHDHIDRIINDRGRSVDGDGRSRPSDCTRMKLMGCCRSQFEGSVLRVDPASSADIHFHPGMILHGGCRLSALSLNK